jgi:hypothetical protein
MTKARAIAFATIAADELRGMIVCASALALIFASSWLPV